MPTWIIAAAIGSIAITALLTWQLYRMNKPMLDEAKREGAVRRANNGDSGGGDVGGPYVGGSDRHDSSHDGGSDGGGDGGGGDGGGGGD